MSHSEYVSAVETMLELLGLEPDDPAIDKVDIFVDAVIAASVRARSSDYDDPGLAKSYETMSVGTLNALCRSWHHFNVIGSPYLDQDDGSIGVLVEIFREIEEPHEGDGIPF